MELFKASKQWANRPQDERFWSIQEAEQKTREYYEHSFDEMYSVNQLRVVPYTSDAELHLSVGNSREENGAIISNYAFEQLCRQGDPSAPPSYLRKLSSDLATQNLNFCLSQRDSSAKLLFHKIPDSNEMILRASNSEIYTRLWNCEIFDRLLDFRAWKVPPAYPVDYDDPRNRPATKEDVDGLPTSIRIGDEIGPSGIYASDHDMFVFMVQKGSILGDGLSRGFFLWNSEVGDKSFGFCRFLFNHVCGNHIVWNAKEVLEFRIRHVGQMKDRAFEEMTAEIKKYSDESDSDERAIIEKSKTVRLGKSKDEVVAVLLGLAQKVSAPELNQKVLSSSYDIAKKREEWYGDPNSLWAMLNGVSEYSQSIPFAEGRNKLDRAAGKMLEAIN